MKNQFCFILAVSLILSGCSSAPSPTRKQAMPSPTQAEMGTITPLSTYTQTPGITITPSITITREQKVELTPSPSFTPTLLPDNSKPTSSPLSLHKLQIINRTNVGQIVPIWRYEPKDNWPESQGGEFAFSPDGKTIAFSVGDHVELVDIEMGKTVQTFSLDNLVPQWAQQKVYSLTFSPGGKRLAGLTEVGVILWDVSSEKPLWITKREEDSNESFTKMIFSPAGDVIVTTSTAYGSDIRVWSSETGKQIKALGKNNQLDAIFNLDGTRLFTVDRLDSIIRAWDTKKWEEVDFPNEMKAYVTLTISPNGKIVAVNCGWNGVGEQITELYQLDNWKSLGYLITPSEEGFTFGPTRIEPSFNRDGGILALAIAEDWMDSPPNHIELWDTSSLKLIASLDETFPTPIIWVAFSPDGRLLVARSDNGTAVFWGIPTE